MADVIHRIKFIIFDVDGVLTDGSIIYDERGNQLKRFHVRDGLGLQLAREAGLRVAVLSSRDTPAVTRRMRELAVDRVVQGSGEKGADFERLVRDEGVEPSEAAYVGDDLLDLPAMTRCGYPIAVADAAPEVRAAATWTTTLPGGRGAAREAVEHILKAQGRWKSYPTHLKKD